MWLWIMYIAFCWGQLWISLINLKESLPLCTGKNLVVVKILISNKTMTLSIRLTMCTDIEKFASTLHVSKRLARNCTQFSAKSMTNRLKMARNNKAMHFQILIFKKKTIKCGYVVWVPLQHWRMSSILKFSLTYLFLFYFLIIY